MTNGSTVSRALHILMYSNSHVYCKVWPGHRLAHHGPLQKTRCAQNVSVVNTMSIFVDDGDGDGVGGREKRTDNVRTTETSNRAADVGMHFFVPSFFLNWNSKYINEPCSSLHRDALFVTEFISDIWFFFLLSPAVGCCWFKIWCLRRDARRKTDITNQTIIVLKYFEFVWIFLVFFFSFRIMSEGDL